jgi:hypothetical protein
MRTAAALGVLVYLFVAGAPARSNAPATTASSTPTLSTVDSSPTTTRPLPPIWRYQEPQGPDGRRVRGGYLR